MQSATFFQMVCWFDRNAVRGAEVQDLGCIAQKQDLKKQHLWPQFFSWIY